MMANSPTIVLTYNTSWYVWNFRMPLILALKERGCEVVVLAPRDAYTDRIIKAGIAWRGIALRARGKNPFQEIRTALAFFQAYREIRPNVALHFTIKPNLYGSIAARILRVPSISNVTGLGAVFEKGGVTRSGVRLFYKVAFAKVEKVFFQNPDDLDSFLREGLVAKSRSDLLPGSGVDLQRFSPRQRGPGPFTFLFIGRLLRAKGVEDLLAASCIVNSKRRGLRIILLGKRDDDDPEGADPRLLTEASRQGAVELAGVVDDVRPFLAAADCVVLPSYYREGIPRSLLEAAAMGKPLIAADSIGTREPVCEGVNGFLCRPRDPEDLAARMLAIAELSEEARSRMGEASRRIAEERFDERIVISKYLETIDQLVRKAR